MKIVDLTTALELEPLEVNLFRGTSVDTSPGRIFGGQVIAQALLAAYATVEDRLCHSLHCYFIRPGDPTVPIIFEVDRSRDGGSFTTRRVIAVQHGKQIFNLAASFMRHEKGFEHQAPMPAAPDPQTLHDDIEAQLIAVEAMPDPPKEAMKWLSRRWPVEMRSVDGANFYSESERKPPTSQVWIRARNPIGPDQHLHQVIAAFASDMRLLGTAMRPHGLTLQSKGSQVASLDHAMWFHRPINFNDWHLYDSESTSASGGRGFVRGAIYAQDGTLVASVAQEGLIRIRREKAK